MTENGIILLFAGYCKIYDETVNKSQRRFGMRIIPRLKDNWLIGLVLLLFGMLGLAYSVVNPIHEATDEIRHYRFVRYLVVYGALPVQGEEVCRSQSHHPPLFYVLGAMATFWLDTGRDICASPPGNPFYAYRFGDVGTDNKNQYLHQPDEAFPWHGEALAVHLIRGVNVLLGLGTVWLVYLSGRVLWPQRFDLPLMAASLVAFNPMFLYMSAAINNDVMAAFSGAAVLWACLRLGHDPAGLSQRWGLLFGGLYGVALLSKFNMAAVILLIELTFIWIAWARRQWRQWLLVNGLLLFVAGLIAGWWFVRNQMLYGEPTGFREVTELWGMRDPRQSLPVAISELPAAWSSLWGRFGYGQIPLPGSITNGFFGFMLFALAGLFLRRRPPVSPFALVLLLVNVLLAFAVLFNYMLVSPAGAMGRFFFPGLPALTLLMAAGWGQWFPAKPTNSPAQFPIQQAIFLVIMVSLATMALTRYLAPAYAHPPTFAANTPLPNPIEANFDVLAQLQGYELSQTTLRPGQFLDLTLYWEVLNQPPGDYLLFVHLIDNETNTLVAQRDTHPATGKFPTSQWRPGDRFVDKIRLYLPETAYTPATATLYIGLYAPTYRLGITGRNGEGLGDSLPLGTITLLPAETTSPYPNPSGQNFANEIQLLGYAYNQRLFRPGDTLQLTLYWQALRSNPTNVEVEVRLMDEQGQVRAKADSLPSPPSQSWAAGQLVESSHSILIYDTLPAGTYIIHVALLDVAQQERHNIIADDGHWISNFLELARIRLQP